MSANEAIGFFDSGVGGLTVLKAVREVLPHEDFIYVADSKNVPYGEKSAEFVQKRSLEIVKFLDKHDVKAAVSACNTATALAISVIRKKFDFPVIGIEPGIKPAVSASLSRRIGVLATLGTISSDKYYKLHNGVSHSVLGGVEIISQPCPGLVDEIEKNIFDKNYLIINKLKEYIKPLLECDIDQIVLGCTHYSLVKEEIKTMVGEDVVIIDTADAVAKHLEKKLVNAGLKTSQHRPGKLSLYSGKNDEKFQKMFAKILGVDIQSKKLPI